MYLASVNAHSTAVVLENKTFYIWVYMHVFIEHLQSVSQWIKHKRKQYINRLMYLNLFWIHISGFRCLKVRTALGPLLELEGKYFCIVLSALNPFSFIFPSLNLSYSLSVKCWVIFTMSYVPHNIKPETPEFLVYSHKMLLESLALSHLPFQWVT